MRTKTALFFLAAFPLLASCATQPTIAPGPLGEAQSKLTEARSLTKPTETRITDYFEAAEIAEQEAQSQSADAAIKQQARQAYNNACAEVTVLLEEADGGKYWNQNERIGAYNVRFQPSTSNGLWSPGFFDQLKPAKESDHKHLRIWVRGAGFGGTLARLGHRSIERKRLLRGRHFLCRFSLQANPPSSFPMQRYHSVAITAAIALCSLLPVSESHA